MIAQTWAAAIFASSSPARSKVFCGGSWQEALWSRGACVSLQYCLPQEELLVTEDRGNHYQQESGKRGKQSVAERCLLHLATWRVRGVLPGRRLPRRRLYALRVAGRQRGNRAACATCLTASHRLSFGCRWCGLHQGQRLFCCSASDENPDICTAKRDCMPLVSS